jgi:small-conductance mechanosensitive channel
MNFQIVVDSLTKIVTDIINFIPNLINGLIILIVGYLVARLVQWLVDFALRQLRFDPLVERTGVTGAIRGLGVKMPVSRIVAQTIYFLLLLSFLIQATRLMGLEAVARLLEQLLDFLPKAIAAIIVFLLGGIVAKFMGDLVTTAAKGAALTYAARLGSMVQYLISLFVVILALGVLGIDTALLVTALTITIAAFGLALGLALGLGARSVVQHVLAGYYLRQRLPVGQPIRLDQVQGEVGGIGGVNTLVTTPDGSVIIPNSILLESIVLAPPRPEPSSS